MCYNLFMEKYFINLTNGIEAIPALKSEGKDFAFIRIQSTVCEQKDWARLLMDLDNNFLMQLALGFDCIVFDFGARKKTARAVYQGLEFVRFACSVCWLGEAEEPLVRGNKCGPYFYKSYNELPDRVLNKLKFYRTYFRGKISLRGVSEATTHDNDKAFYQDIINGHINGQF